MNEQTNKATALAEGKRGRPWWVTSLIGAGGMILALLLVATLVEFGGSSTDMRVGMTFFIYLIVALGVQIFTGYSGLISFAHVGFMAVGGYVSAILTTPTVIKETSLPNAPTWLIETELSLWVAGAIAVALVMVLAVIIGGPLMRLNGAPAAVGTIGVLIIVNTVLSNADAVTRGAQAFYGIPNETTIFIAFAGAGVALVIARLFRDSNIGLGLRSSKLDTLGSQASGVNVHRSRLIAWTLGAGLAGAGGVLFAHYLSTLLPAMFMFELTLTILTMIIIGGPTVSGAVVGAGIVTMVTEVLRRAEDSFSLPGLSTVILGILILVTMIVRPGGLLGRWEIDVWIRQRMAAFRGRSQTRITNQGEKL